MEYQIELHPWDITEEGAASTLRSIVATGVKGISLTAAWPGQAVLRPRAAGQRLHFPDRGAVYFKPDDEHWKDSDLVPKVAELVLIDDYFNSLPGPAHDEDLSVEARIVFLPYVPSPLKSPPSSSSQVKSKFAPEKLYVKNAFGDRLPGYLCPAHESVRKYFVDLVCDVARHNINGVALESYGYPLFDFGHLPGAEVLSTAPAAQFLMGVCFCDACTERGESTNIDISPLAWRVRSFLERVLSGEETGVPPLSEKPDGLGEIDELLPAYLRVRNDIVGTLIRDLQAAMPDDVSLTTVSGSRWPSWQAWREGGEIARLAAGSDVIRLQGDAPDAVGLVLDVQRAGERAAGRAKLGARITPGPPHADSYKAFSEKVAVGRDFELHNIVFSGYGELAEAHLKWIPRVISELS